MVYIQCSHFSLRHICRSGQCFRMEELESTNGQKARLIAHGRYIEISQTGTEICFACPQSDYDEIWKQYFDMDTDYAQIIDNIDAEDAYLTAAAAFGRGIRILRQDIWEMIISFIISQQNNIKRIRNCIRLLCEKYGESKMTDTGQMYFDFPTPHALADTTIEELYACGLGYRSRYIFETANAVWRGDVDLAALYHMKYAEARQELLKLCGVGQKVADCICLFALHITEAFPRDTHINKVLETRYPEGFPFERYGVYSGILQQYMFYYDLNKVESKIFSTALI